MTRSARHGTRACTIVLVGAAMLAGLAGTAFAQNSVGGTGYGVRAAIVGEDTVLPRPEVVLPDDGGTTSAHLLTLALPGVVGTGTIDVDATGTAAGPASVTTTASVEDLNLLNGLVTADLVVARSSSTGNGTTASSNATGSQFVNLSVAGVPIVIFPAPNTVIAVPGVATVFLNEQIPGGNGTSTSSLTVNMIRVVLLNGLGEAVVSSAHSDVDFRTLAPTCLCSQPDDDLTGEAYGLHVSVDPPLLPPLIDTGRDPRAVLSSEGGSASASAATAVVGTLLGADTVSAVTTGTLAPGSGTSQSTATVEGLDLLGGLITADVVVARATSTGNGTTASSNVTGSQFVNLFVLGLPIAILPAPNTVIALPLVGSVTLNEQVPSGNGTTTSGMLVHMIHVRLNGTLGVGDIIVASAESGVDVTAANVCPNPCSNDNDLCNGSSVCDPFLGCTNVPLVCDDGNACNGAETCDPTNGCGAGTPLVCDDANVCNGNETCNPASGCVDGTDLVCAPNEVCEPAIGCTAAPDCEFLVSNYIRVKDGSIIEGDLRAAECGAFITLGQNAYMADDTTLESTMVQLGNGADVYHVAADDIRQGQDVSIRGGTSLNACPLAFCSVPDVVCGGERVTLAKGATRTLTPGSYGAVSVGNNANLRLQPGAYTFCSLKMGRTATMQVQGPAASSIYIDGKVVVGNGSLILTDNAPRPTIQVSGKSVKFGALAEIDAHLVAPAASASFGRNAIVRGSFCIHRGNTDHSVLFTCQP